MIGIDARSSDVLKATLLSVHAAPKNIQQNIKHYTSSELKPIWRQELDDQQHTPAQARLLIGTSQVTTTNTQVNLRSGGTSASLSGGLSTDYTNKGSGGSNPFSYKALAFGANPQAVRTYKAKSKHGIVYMVKNRHTQRGLPPIGDYVVVPAAQAFIPRAAALWVATVVRTLHDALEGKLK